MMAEICRSSVTRSGVNGPLTSSASSNGSINTVLLLLMTIRISFLAVEKSQERNVMPCSTVWILESIFRNDS